MNSKKMNNWSSILLFVLFSVFSGIEAELQVGFYNYLCPSAETIVREEVTKASARNSESAPGLIRLHFHDCFFNGCDASVLIDSTADINAEKDSPANKQNLRAFEVIDSAKKRIEAKCAKTVSCADILAFAARDSVKITQGVSYDVPAGRRDGKVSSTTDALTNLSGSDVDLDMLNQSLLSNGISLGDNTEGLSTPDKFAAAMVKMDKIQVLEGTHGEIRSACRVFN